VSSKQSYRVLAQYYLGLAKVSIDPDTADRYRTIAADYFDLAELAGESSASVIQQQQQVQPDKGAK
jgi:hypothetical protein